MSALNKFRGNDNERSKCRFVRRADITKKFSTGGFEPEAVKLGG